MSSTSVGTATVVVFQKTLSSHLICIAGCKLGDLHLRLQDLDTFLQGPGRRSDLVTHSPTSGDALRELHRSMSQLIREHEDGRVRAMGELRRFLVHGYGIPREIVYDDDE